jgi:hypothetical protein
VTLNFPTISLIVFNPVMSVQAPVLHQRVYRNKGNHRRIGLLTDVDGDFVRVLWANETASSGLTAYHGLTAVSIHVGATVIRGITYPAEPITALTPLFGVVTNIDEYCTVTWDDCTVTTQPSQDVMDVVVGAIRWAMYVRSGSGERKRIRRMSNRKQTNK